MTIPISKKGPKRIRGVILTPTGLDKLKAAKAESEDNDGHRYTLEQLNARTQLSVDTLMKIFACEAKVDKSSLKDCFKAFNLILDNHDYFYPDIDLDSSSVDTSESTEADEEDSIIYIERPPIEQNCYEKLLQPGAMIRVKAPSLMGKTLLMSWVLTQLAHKNYRTLYLSLKLADRKTHLTDLNKFLRWFCCNLARELGVPNKIENYWDEDNIGAKASCTTYLEEYLLALEDSPLVLCLDDVDLLFPHPAISEDFFGLLRSWYEKGRSRPRWKKLRLALVHATDVCIRLNINQSPFNVGLPVELCDFTFEQIQEFASQHQITLTSNQIKELMNMIGGHPYLLEQTFTYLNNNPLLTLEQVLKDAPTDGGIYGSHLRKFWLNLKKNHQLNATIKKIVTCDSPIQIGPMETHQLYSMGLININGNQVQPRCNLYRLYFCSHLENLK